MVEGDVEVEVVVDCAVAGDGPLEQKSAAQAVEDQYLLCPCPPHRVPLSMTVGHRGRV